MPCWDWLSIFPDHFNILSFWRDIVSLKGDYKHQLLKDYNCAPTSSAGEAMGKSCSEASELAEWYANGAINETSTLIEHRKTHCIMHL